MKQNIGPTSLVSYISFTLLFFILKNQFKFPGTTWIWIFLLISGLIQFINNLYLTHLPEICGSYNVNSAFTATIVPWVCIFAVTCFCLIYIPGWLRVFSNTFGAGIANMGGMQEVVSKLFVGNPNSSDGEMKETIALLYTNIGKFVNEINLDYQEIKRQDGSVDRNIDNSPKMKWDSLDAVMRVMNIDPSGKDALKNDLYKMLVLKEDAGYFMWFILIGSISVLISTNSLLLTTCNAVEFNL
jgi:hypothetical protein